VSFVVDGQDAVKAVQELHRHLFEQPSSSPSHAASSAPQKTAQA
jgi:hypothetical protein